MRKQYYLRPSPGGILAWDVDRLVDHLALIDDADVASLPSKDMKTGTLQSVWKQAGLA